MNLNDFLLQLYNTGILAIAIMVLAIAVTIHGTHQKPTRASSNKTSYHRIRK